MLLIDGIKYNLWVPEKESQLEEIVKEYFTDIFSKNSLYFDIKPELRSRTGIGSKPDGIVILFDKPCYYVVEIERAKHGIHDHVITQISRFNTALKRPETKMKMAEAVYNEILSDPLKELFVKSKVKGDLFKFLTDLFSLNPIIAIIIDEVTDEIKEAIDELPLESRIVEFKIFEREGVGIAVHAHLFEPVYVPPVKPQPPAKEKEEMISGVKAGDTLEVEIKTESYRKYALFYVSKKDRRFFPGYKVDFILETDIGDIQTRVMGHLKGLL